ncbi:MAG: alanine racemase [Rickettsiales bacterium]|nr:alanine racemase [Rickettsiales bacterium]
MALHAPTLTVDLNALCANYRQLKAHHVQGRIAAVVKADAYGLGMVSVAQALSRQTQCSEFFVATLEEAIRLRAALPQASIYVFAGVLRGEEADYLAHHLSPVLNTIPQLERWRAARLSALDLGRPVASAALHVDTGMCRLGLSVEDVPKIHPASVTNECGVDLLMSHLACASEPDHCLNNEQLSLFQHARQFFPELRASLANSSGLFLDASYHMDLGRPGCALYGITPNPALPNPMQPVVTWTAPILQIRTVERDQPIGYGATMTVTRGMKVATLASGYADGLHRSASPHLAAWIDDYRCPMLGRVSMDLTCYDVTEVPEAVLETTDDLTLMGPHQSVDQVADAYGTIGYEVLCHLGQRLQRCYVE